MAMFLQQQLEDMQRRLDSQNKHMTILREENRALSSRLNKGRQGLKVPHPKREETNTKGSQTGAGEIVDLTDDVETIAFAGVPLVLERPTIKLEVKAPKEQQPPKKEPSANHVSGFPPTSGSSSPPNSKTEADGDRTNDDSTAQVLVTQKRSSSSERAPGLVKRTKVEEPSLGTPVYSRVKQEHKEEDVKTFLEELKNPDIKVKIKDDLSLEELVYNRLHTHDIKNLKLDIDLRMRTATVTRRWMTSTLGGGMQCMVSKVAPEKAARHGYDHFMFVNLAYHPDAPQRPGAAGLLYGVGGATAIPRIPPVARVFVNVASARWLYMADYEIREVEPLTVAEWLQVPERVRMKWATEICTETWAKLFRVRTILRRMYGVEYPQDALVAAARDREPWLNVTAEEISATLDTGIERFHVFTMKPVHYDDVLQAKLIRWNDDTNAGRVPQL